MGAILFMNVYIGWFIYINIGYSKSSSPVGTLGVVCKCCDGEGGACRTKWDAPCSKLQCLPWKSRYI